jgi:hypothetical protein
VDAPPETAFIIGKGDWVRFAVRTLTFTKATANNKGVMSYTTTSSLTSNVTNTQPDTNAVGVARRSPSGSLGSLSGVDEPGGSVLRKRSASIDLLLNSAASSLGTLHQDAALVSSGAAAIPSLTAFMSAATGVSSSAPPSSAARSVVAVSTPNLPSHHHPMRVIGSIDGDGLGLLSWWQ